MRFRKHVTVEEQEFLTELLKQYKAETPMSPEERKELHKWVAAGHSPYENGSYCYGAGGLVDFISAYRSEIEREEWFNSLTPEEQHFERIGYTPCVADDQDMDFEYEESAINTYVPNEYEELPFK